MASQRSGSSSPSSGDHYNNETAGVSCWSPRTWHIDGNLGLRAEDAAPRSNAPRDSGRPERVCTRQGARLVGPALCRLRCNPAKEPTQASPTRLVRSALRQHVAILPASRSASNAASLREQPAQASVPPLHLFFCPSDQPQGIHTGIESPRQEARFAGPALCQLLRNSEEEPTQASITRLVRSALRQHVVHLPVSSSAFY